MKLLFRYPDNPNQVGPAVLLQVEREEPGKFVGQFKWDGWRHPLYFYEGKWHEFAKHTYQAKKEVPAALLKELESLQFPEGTAFDTEWMGNRCTLALNGRHFFVLFDLLYYNGKWQGDVPYIERYGNLKTLVELHKAKAGKDTPNIILEPIREVGLEAMFQESKKNPLTEGIVVKARNSKLKGGTIACQHNGSWMKVKWRQ
jgi:ATP-dependent DNA ligase